MARVKYCTLCERNVEPRRKIGVGTLILFLLTLGVWLIAIPFYLKRCPICRTDALERPQPAPRR